MKRIEVKANDSGQRLDKFLQKSFESLPKSMMFKQIRKKNIKINRKRCTPEQIICEGDIIELYLNDDLLIEKKKHYDFLNAPKNIDIVYYAPMSIKSIVLNGMKMKKSDGSRKTGTELKQEIQQTVFNIFDNVNFENITDDVTDAISIVITYLRQDGKPIGKQSANTKSKLAKKKASNQDELTKNTSIKTEAKEKKSKTKTKAKTENKVTKSKK